MPDDENLSENKIGGSKMETMNSVEVVEAAKVVGVGTKETYLLTKAGMLTPEQIVDRFYYPQYGYLSGRKVPEATANHPAVVAKVSALRLQALKNKFNSPIK
jgi:hypothetical protein